MPESLALAGETLSAAEASLRAASVSLESSVHIGRFAFDSLTGVADAACEFLRSFDAAVENLIIASDDGSGAITSLGLDAAELDVRLAGACASSRPATTGATVLPSVPASAPIPATLAEVSAASSGRA